MRIANAAKQGTFFALALSLLISGTPLCGTAEARSHRHHSAHSSKHSAASSESSGRHHTRHHGRASSRHEKVSAKPRYAYPIDIFMMQGPEQDMSLLAQDDATRIRYAFQSGTADSYSPLMLVRSGAVNFFPLHGGIFRRREEVKYIVVHSTETGVPQDARHVVNAWSSGGRRHPGAQYIVDRDGTIFETIDPQYATVHVNIFKTLPGINNDNSIGIEMCHTGSQNYPPEQRAAVTRLVSYLQDRYHVLNENVITHRYAQQGDHTDPVNFDWDGFLASKDDFHNKALAMKRTTPPEEQLTTEPDNVPEAAVYLEMHKTLNPQEVAMRRTPAIKELQRQMQAIEQVYADTSTKRVNYLDQPYASAPVYAATPAHSGANKLPIRGEIELDPHAAGALSQP